MLAPAKPAAGALAVAGALLSVLILFSSQAEARAVKAIWGPVTLPAGNLECPTSASCSAFPVYSALGVDVYQYRLLWDRIATQRPANPTDPNDPAYKWPADLDKAVAEAAAGGIGLAALVEFTPLWANGGRGATVAPANPRDYANFLVAASRRYPSIARWMIWGEPNRADHFVSGPRAYARLLDAAYGAIKGVDRRDIVTGGMSDNFGTIKPAKWAQRLKLKGGRRPRMDEYGHNAFDSRFPRLQQKPLATFRGLSDVDTLWREVRRAFRKSKRPRPKGIWVTEWTVQTDQDSFAFAFHVSEDEQASWVSAGYALAAGARYVSGLGWFSLADQPPASRSANWGLETSSGRRKPSFGAYAAVP